MDHSTRKRIEMKNGLSVAVFAGVCVVVTLGLRLYSEKDDAVSSSAKELLETIKEIRVD